MKTHRTVVLLSFVLLSVVSPALFAEDDETVLRIMSYNIHHGEGTDGKLDLERTGKVIKQWNPDLVAVQEVDRKTRRTRQIDQAEILAEQLGMHHAFGKTIDYQGGEYGLAVLSKFPILKHEMILLPPEKQQEQRGVLVVEVEIPLGHSKPEGATEKRKIRFACTHISYFSEEEQLPQVEKINELFCGEKDELPTIIAGDFNARPRSKAIEIVRQHWTDAAEAVGEPKKDERRIDYIFFRSKDPFRVREFKRIEDRITSDHDPIFSILVL